MSTSVALGRHFEEFVRKQIASGRFNNVSEVLRAGLRLLEDQEKLHTLKREELRAELRKGMNSGPTIPAADVRARGTARMKAKLEKHKQ
jgi:antitoxin ParD1/3/4